MPQPKILILDGYETDYILYPGGMLWSNKRNRFLKTYMHNSGYAGYKIGSRWWGVHRLLAETFIPNPDNLETVNHKDKNKLNNSLDNLEWMSREDNVKHGLQKEYSLVSPEGKLITFVGQAEFCRKMELNQQNISKVLLGERPHHKGWTCA